MRKVKCTDCDGPLPEGRKRGVCEDCKQFGKWLTHLRMGDIDYSPVAVAERARRADIYRARFERNEPIFQEELTNGSPEDCQIEIAQGRSGKAYAAASDQGEESGEDEEG